MLFTIAAIISMTAGADIPGPVTAVETWRGLPAFTINGEPHMSTSFETYVPSVRHFKQMAEAGATVFGFPTNCGEEPYWHSTPVWVGPDVWDFSELDESIGKILEADPQAYIMPRINVSEPEWWRDANPNELMVFDDGTVDYREPYRLWPACKSRTIASICSQKWRDDMAMSLRRLIEHIQQAPYADRVFAYQIFSQATEEWYHYTLGHAQTSDYSVHMQRAFQDWLRKKYGADDALQAAWGRPVAFEDVQIPSKERRWAGYSERAFRDPATEMDVIDFYDFYNAVIPEAIDFFCGVAKDACGRTKAVGAFYAYMYEFCGRGESGHMAVQQLLQSSNCDFIVVTASYGQRQLGSGGSILRSPHTSLRLHNKLWYEDNDTVSYLFPQVSQRIGDAEWERSKEVLAATDTAEQSKWIYERGAGFVLGNGVYQALFDLHGGYFDDPELLQAVKGIYRVFNESAQYERTSCSEILVIADERSIFYSTEDSPLLAQSLYDPPYRLIKCGAPYDSVYVNDLALLDTSPYKLFIVLNTYCLDDAQRALLQEKVMQPGKTVFWAGAPGLFTEGKRIPEGMSAVTGIRLSAPELDAIVPGTMELDAAAPGFPGRLVQAGVTSVGPEAPGGPLVYADDPDAVVLARHAASKKPMLVKKDVNGATSIYSITASAPVAFYRELARDAGVHLYNEQDDTLYVSQSYLTLNADGAGERILRFPMPVDLYDAVSNEKLASQTTAHPIAFRDLETRIFRIERNPSASPSAAIPEEEHQ